MTQKELLYVEDAIGHESNIISILDMTINSLEDDNLVTFLQKELKGHKAMKEKLIKMLEGYSNE